MGASSTSHPRLHFPPPTTFKLRKYRDLMPGCLLGTDTPNRWDHPPSTFRHGPETRAVSVNSKLKVVEKRPVVR